jgi:FKBP-type peptidyl-prolyl cis-trans isomerase
MHKTHTSRICHASAFTGFLLAGSVALAQAPPVSEGTPGPTTSAPAPDGQSSYGIGLVFGSQLHGAGLDNTLSFDAVMRGFKDGMEGKALTEEYKQRAIQLMRAGRENLAARNHAAARDFLAKNAKVEGITATASGLQYRVFRAGDANGASPTGSDTVTVNYRGQLLDGTEFDSSDNYPQAATFGLNGVIKGWQEALSLMKPGAKWRLFVPPELAYDVNSPPPIPPASLLIFDVELLKVGAPPPGGQGARQPPGS